MSKLPLFNISCLLPCVPISPFFSVLYFSIFIFQQLHLETYATEPQGSRGSTRISPRYSAIQKVVSSRGRFLKRARSYWNEDDDLEELRLRREREGSSSRYKV